MLISCRVLEETIIIVTSLTHVREVIDQNDLLDQMLGRSIEDRVDGAQEHRPGFVVETDDDRCGGEIHEVAPWLFAPVNNLLPIR